MNLTLEEALRRQMEYLRIPGATAAVVCGDEVRYVCLGVKDVEKESAGDNLVDPRTQFTLASVSKSFNTAMIGRLVDEGILDWDVPVRTYAPELRMMDPEADEKMTLRDMLCHRTGLANHDAIWPAEFSHEEVAKCLRHMEPDQKFREVAQYNNTIYVMAGYVAEAVTGKSWHQLVKEYIFDPLGMEHTCSELDKMVASGNFSEPHKFLNGKVRKVDRWPMDEAAAAAGVNSCAEDMAKWLKFHISGGFNDKGERLLSEETYAEIHRGLMPYQGDDMGADEIQLRKYALGWRDGTYRGRRIFTHTGHIEGFCTVEMVMPDDDIGVFVSVNLHDNCTDVHMRAAYTEIDNLLGYEKDWLYNLPEGMRGVCSAAGDVTAAEASAGCGKNLAKEEHCPPYRYMGNFLDWTPLAQYPCEEHFDNSALIGTYVSKAYGPIRIFERDGKLFSAYHFKEDELHWIKGTTYMADGFLEDTWYMKMPFEFIPFEYFPKEACASESEASRPSDAPGQPGFPGGFGLPVQSSMCDQRIAALVIPLEKTVKPIWFVRSEQS